MRKKNLYQEGYDIGYDKGYVVGHYDAIAEMTWKCGDCGNTYEESVRNCPNDRLDQAIISLKKEGIGYE
jgi:hypothetical protein